MELPKSHLIRQCYDNMEYNAIFPAEDKVITDVRNRLDIRQINKKLLPDVLVKWLFEIGDLIDRDKNYLENVLISCTETNMKSDKIEIDLLASCARYYGTLILRDNLWQRVNIDGGTWPVNAICSICHTISMIIRSRRVQSYIRCISLPESQNATIDTAIIVMADADICSVIWFLKLNGIGNPDNHDQGPWRITKIWIQEPIKDEFINLLNEKLKDDASNANSIIHGFRYKNEALQKLENEANIKAVSICSSDVAAAKYMADIINRVFLIWINCHGEFGPGILLPWKCEEPLNITVPPCHPSPIPKTKYIEGRKTINHFYDGAWNEPLCTHYEEDKNSILWESITEIDVKQCVISAESGYKKWRSLPLSRKQKCFHNLAKYFRSNGESELASSISVWAEWPLLYGSSSIKINDGAVELTTTREPKGVIAITCNARKELFRRIVCACIIGNSVIVAKSMVKDEIGESGIKQFCDALTTCGIPSGVVNFLLFANAHAAVEYLSEIPSIALICKDMYTDTSTDTSKDNSIPSYWVNTCDDDEYSDAKLYAKYSRPKSVWLPLN